jgi:predicted peptidase
MRNIGMLVSAPLTVLAALLTSGLLTSLTTAAQPAAPQASETRPPELSSEELAKQPQTPGATGDQQRHYYFAEAKTELPYRIYVPKGYDGKTKMPLILALHGAGGNQNYFFKATYGMPDLMDRYGFIFVEPLGYSRFGGYGAANLARVPVDPDPNILPNPQPRGRPQLTPEEAAHATELSEKDVMKVLDIVEKEYNIDVARVYLMGHSMGGNGTWYLGQKYADKWAAIAPMSSGFGYVDYPLDRLKGIPIMVTAGSRDIAMHGPQAQAQVARYKAAGLDIRYVEIPDGSHMSNIPSAFPQVIQFLATHHR